MSGALRLAGRGGGLRVAVALAAVAGMVFVLSVAPDLIGLVLLGATLAYLLNPLVDQLERQGAGRTLGTAFVLGGLGFILATSVYLAAPTVADGIAVKRPGELTLRLVRDWVDEIVVVGEDETAEAMVLLLEQAKLVVEGGGAVGVAALLGGQIAAAAQGTTCVVLSGGNVDAGLLAVVARRHETEAGRRLVLFTRVADRPGGLAALLALLGDTGANLVDVEHVREGVDLHVRETAVQLVLETRGREHAQRVTAALAGAGYAATVVR